MKKKYKSIVLNFSFNKIEYETGVLKPNACDALLAKKMADGNAAITAISKAESQTHRAEASLVKVNYYYRVHWIWTIATLLDEYELRIV